MELTAPCKHCGQPYSYLCSHCTTHTKGTQPICIHCCPKKGEHRV